MNIDLSKVPTLWYENKEGDRWLPNFDGLGHPEEGLPAGFMYQHSQFPSQLRESVHYIIQKGDVEACEHPKAAIRNSGPWDESPHSRKCRKCGGTQEIKEDGTWSAAWNAYGSQEIMSGNSGWSEDLVLAIVTAQARPPGHPHMSLGEAILVAASACERCMNTLANQYGLDWGYEYMSDDWKKCGTECTFCEHDGFQRVPRDPEDPLHTAPVPSA